jgi:hypothetical protein
VSPDDVTIEVLDIDLQRQGQILPDNWTDVLAKSALRGVGEWSLSLPADHPRAADLAQPGAGILITGPTGELFSGPVTSPEETADQKDPGASIKFSGTDYLCIVADALAYPDPAHAATDQALAYDVRTGPAETVIRSLIDANIGSSALATRRGIFASKLRLDVDQARGQTLTSSSRFDNLLDQTAGLGKLAGLGFRIEVVDGSLVLRFFTPEDHSADVRLDIANGRLTSYKYTTSAPTVTRPIVGGQGEGVDRHFVERTNDAAVAAEAAWGRRIEAFVDQRQTNVDTELEQAGDEALTNGAAGDKFELSPTDDDTMRYQLDWALGDYVTAVTSRGEVAQIVTKVGLSASKDGIYLAAEVGDLDSEDLQALQLRRRVTRLETRI